MIIKEIKADLSDTAQEKMKVLVEQAVETKIQKEMKKLAKALTAKFIITGVAMAGAFLLINKADTLAGLLFKSKEE